MPKVFDHGPYRVYFFSYEPNEPPHVHVARDRCSCKFWLQPVQLARNEGFPEHELTRIRNMLRDNRDRCLRAWYGHL